MIHLIDTRRPGLTTLEGALDRLGFSHRRVARPAEVQAAGPLILPDGGAYEEVAGLLRTAGWWREVPQLVADGRYLLGLGLGLHFLAEGSEEAPRGSGLGLIPGLVRRLGQGARSPHLGWSQVTRAGTHPGLPDLHGGWLYFAHSHALEPTSETLDLATHGRPFSVLECRGRVLGLQAHPEKSGPLGLVLLEKLMACMGEQRANPDGCN